MTKLTEGKAYTYTAALVVITFFIRLYIAAYTGLGIGESYYFRGSLHLDLSYFDQPPLFFWLSALSIKLLGVTTLGLRLPAVVLFAGTSWLLFLVTRLLFNARAGFWAVLLINLSAVFTIPIACWYQPDAPLMFFWMLSTYFIVKLMLLEKPATGSNWHTRKIYGLWVLIGICMGLDTLSKYHVLFLFVGAFAFIIANKNQRHWLHHPGPYIAILITFIFAAPIIWWNYHNNWVSFVFQGSRAGSGDTGFHLHFEFLLRSIGGQALWLLPWIWVPLIRELFKSYKLGKTLQAYSFCFWTAVFPIIFFTIVTLWRDLQYHFHWQAPGYMMLFMPLGYAVDQHLNSAEFTQRKRTKNWLVFTSCFTVIVITVLLAHMITGFWHAYGPKQLVALGGEKVDPTVQGIDYVDIKTRFEKEGWLQNKHIFTGAPRWWLTGKVDWALKGEKPVIVFDDDPRNLAFLVNPNTLVHDDAVVIAQDQAQSIIDNVQPFFDSVKQLPDIIVTRNGRDELHLQVYYCKNFHVSKAKHEELPLYHQLTGRPPFGK